METYEFSELEQKASNIDFQAIHEQIQDLVTNKENISQEITKQKTLREEISLWTALDTPLAILKSFQHCQAFFGTLPKKLFEKLETALSENNCTYFSKINETKDHVYLLVISHRSEAESVHDTLLQHSFSAVQFQFDGTPADEMLKLEEQIKAYESEMNGIEQKLADMADNHLPDLEIMYDYLMTKKVRFGALEKFVKTDYTEIIEGYIPVHMAESFEAVVKKKLGDSYYLEMKEADKDDPTSLYY